MSGKQLAPLDAFMDRVKAKLRDDIGSLLPDEAVQAMVEKVINDEFFKPRLEPKPGRGSYSTETIEVPAKFAQMVIEAALPVLEKHAMLVAEQHAAEIEAQIKQSVESGLITMALKSLDNVFTMALESHGWSIQQTIENNLRSKGLIR